MIEFDPDLELEVDVYAGCGGLVVFSGEVEGAVRAGDAQVPSDPATDPDV